MHRLKWFKKNCNLKYLHLNDQLGDCGSGHDLHASLGRGHIFTNDSDSVDLLYYAVTSFDVVLEYTKD